MRKIIWIFALSLVAVVLFLEYDVTQRLQVRQTRRLSSLRSSAVPQNQIPALSSQTQINTMPAAVNFETQFTEVTQEVSRLQENPEAAENKMQTLAAQYIKKLADVMQDSKNNGDQRAMAVEILSRHQSIESLKKLEDFIQQPSESGAWNRNREFESVLRAQAIEGIASYPQKDLALSSLRALDPKLNESFLKDRIQRSMAGLKNQAPAAEKQDDEALRKLVE